MEQYNSLFSDFATAFDALCRIAHNSPNTLEGTVATKYLEPLKERWEWVPEEEFPFVRRKLDHNR